MNGLTVADFLPAALYLAVVTMLLIGARRCPVYVHATYLAVCVPWRVIQAGWLDALIPVGVALLVLLAGVILTSRLVTGVTLFALVTSLALLPLNIGWVAIGAGLGLCALVSVWKTIRLAGRDRVMLLGMQTAHALGWSPVGLQKPDLGHLPTREQTAPEDAGEGQPARARVYLPPYLLAGVVATAALTLP